MISPTQAELARRILKLSQQQVANALGVSNATLSKIENGESDPPASRLEQLQDFYENQGVEFLEGDGVRKRQTYVRRYRGAEGFRDFMDHVYEVARDVGGEICLYNARPANWLKFLGESWNAMHSERMAKLADQIDFKATTRQGDTQLIGHRHAEYRWVPEEIWNQQSVYAYGDYIAFLIFDDDEVSIFNLREKQVADSFRALFNICWETVAKVPEMEGPSKPSNR